VRRLRREASPTGHPQPLLTGLPVRMPGKELSVARAAGAEDT
jgi:hypothetical protein